MKVGLIPLRGKTTLYASHCGLDEQESNPDDIPPHPGPPHYLEQPRLGGHAAS